MVLCSSAEDAMAQDDPDGVEDDLGLESAGEQSTDYNDMRMI